MCYCRVSFFPFLTGICSCESAMNLQESMASKRIHNEQPFPMNQNKISSKHQSKRLSFNMINKSTRSNPLLPLPLFPSIPTFPSSHSPHSCHSQPTIYNISGAMWKNSFSTAQLQFFSTIRANVTILPNFSDSQLYLISGKIGPFKANHETTVPLWLALQLKANQKCKLIPPFWLDEEVLLDFQDKERKNPTQLIHLQHEEFFEISYIYFSQAPDDVPKLPQMRALVQGLESMRREKVRKLFEEVKGSLRLINLTTFQTNRIRQPLSKLGMMVDRLRKVEK